MSLHQNVLSPLKQRQQVGTPEENQKSEDVHIFGISMSPKDQHVCNMSMNFDLLKLHPAAGRGHELAVATLQK